DASGQCPAVLGTKCALPHGCEGPMRRLLRLLRRAGESALQSLARRILRAIQARRLREWRADELGRSAIVFAPHQDDEVLGCGGTIVRKLRAGADVTVVFLTDGSAA